MNKPNERHNRAIIRQGDDGLPIAATPGIGVVTNDQCIAAIHVLRDGERSMPDASR